MNSNSEVESYIEELLKEEAAEAPATKTPYPYETLEQKAIAEEIRKGDTQRMKELRIRKLTPKEYWLRLCCRAD